MSPDTAQTVWAVGTVVMAVLWLIGLWFLVASSRCGRPAGDLPVDHFAQVEEVPKHALLGSVDVDGPAPVLMERAASLLVRETFGSVKIQERTNERLVFEQVGPGRSEVPKWGQLRFLALGSGRTRIDYAVGLSSYRWLLWLGGFFQTCGLVALVAASWLIHEYCLPSPDPALRTQAVQMVQVIHFVWPPFLCGALYRQRQRNVPQQYALLLQNLPLVNPAA
jgi:hypothetical protein